MSPLQARRGAIMALLIASSSLASASVHADEPRLLVALLPFAADGDVGQKELSGVEALARRAVDDGAYVDLLPTRKDDVATGRKCRDDEDCLRDAARARGVDFIARVTLVGTEQGYDARVVVVASDPTVETRALSHAIDGGALERDVDRLGRLAFRPDTLRGTLVVTGAPEGALVLVDGERIGKLPLAAPIEGVAEGERKVELRAKGYATIVRPVVVVHGETAEVRVILSGERAGLESAISGSEREPSLLASTLAVAPWVLLAGGLVALAAGAACGVFAFMDQAEVERRAEAELLVFPRDAILMRRGLALAIAANVLYATSATTLALAGGALGASLLIDDGGAE